MGDKKKSYVEKTVYLNVFLGSLSYHKDLIQKQPYNNYLRTKKLRPLKILQVLIIKIKIRKKEIYYLIVKKI